jgi:hypothetical protein
MFRFQIQPPDTLITEIAKVKRSIRAQRHAIRFADLGIGVAGYSIADQRRDRGAGGQPGQDRKNAQRQSSQFASSHVVP